MSINPLKTEGASMLLISIGVFLLVIVLSVAMVFTEPKDIISKNKIQINGEDYILRSYIKGGIMYVDTLKQ